MKQGALILGTVCLALYAALAIALAQTTPVSPKASLILHKDVARCTVESLTAALKALRAAYANAPGPEKLPSGLVRPDPSVMGCGESQPYYDRMMGWSCASSLDDPKWLRNRAARLEAEAKAESAIIAAREKVLKQADDALKACAGQ